MQPQQGPSSNPPDTPCLLRLYCATSVENKKNICMHVSIPYHPPPIPSPCFACPAPPCLELLTRPCHRVTDAHPVIRGFDHTQGFPGEGPPPKRPCKSCTLPIKKPCKFSQQWQCNACQNSFSNEVPLWMCTKCAHAPTYCTQYVETKSSPHENKPTPCDGGVSNSEPVNAADPDSGAANGAHDAHPPLLPGDELDATPPLTDGDYDAPPPPLPGDDPDATPPLPFTLHRIRPS